MSQLEEQDIQCPYCGEWIWLDIDPSIRQQSYYEDCQVCCRPIQVQVWFDTPEKRTVRVFRENG